MEKIFRDAKILISDSKLLAGILKKQGRKKLRADEFENLLQAYAPAVYAKKRIVSIVKEVMALYYYNRQNEYRKLRLLLSDDAPEYNKIAENHGLCWVYDARYYNKLFPQLDIHKQKLKTFMSQIVIFTKVC